MLIWRVEHKETGMGPYQSCYDGEYENYDGEYEKHFDNFTNHLGCTHSDDNHPSVVRDIHERSAFKHNSTYYCGFESYESYCAWFNKFFSILDLHGYHLCIYSIDEEYVQFGWKQVAFDKYKATLIAHRKLGRSYAKRYEVL